MFAQHVFLEIRAPRKLSVTELTVMRLYLVVHFSHMSLKIAQSGSGDGQIAVGTLQFQRGGRGSTTFSWEFVVFVEFSDFVIGTVSLHPGNFFVSFIQI